MKEKELTEAAARAARPQKKSYMLNDIRGLYLDISPTGKKYWRFRYTRNGKRSWYTLGEYPDLSILSARNMLPALRKRIKDGLPLEEKPKADMRFAAVYAEWMQDYESRGLTEKNYHRVRAVFKRHILPFLGERDITMITAPDVIDVMKRLADQKKHSTMGDAKIYISMVFKFAAAKGYVTYDPCTLVSGAVSAPPVKHHPTLSRAADVAHLLKAIDTYSGKRVRLAMLFQIYSMCRSGEVVHAEWSEIDLENEQFRIEANKMKKRRTHIVPLTKQLKAILEAMMPLSGHGRYIFPLYRHYLDTETDGMRPMNVGNLARALKRLGFTSDQIVPHGFRSMASTILNENGFNSDWIERQLAHVEGNQVRAAYNYADFLKERRKMLQWYGNYLDKLRGGPMNLD